MIASRPALHAPAGGLALVAATDGSVDAGDRPRGPDRRRNTSTTPPSQRCSRRSPARTTWPRPTRSTGRSRTDVITGPAIGACSSAWARPALAFGVNAASFAAVGALVVARMHARSKAGGRDGGRRGGPAAQMVVGVRTIAAEPPRACSSPSARWSASSTGPTPCCSSRVSDEKLGTGAEGFGYLLAGLGVGGVLLAGTVNRLASSPRLARDHARRRGYCLPTAAADGRPRARDRLPAPGRARRSTLVVDVLAVTALQRVGPARDPGAGLRRVLRVRPRGDLARRADHAADRQRVRPRRGAR